MNVVISKHEKQFNAFCFDVQKSKTIFLKPLHIVCSTSVSFSTNFFQKKERKKVKRFFHLDKKLTRKISLSLIASTRTFFSIISFIIFVFFIFFFISNLEEQSPFTKYKNSQNKICVSSTICKEFLGTF